MFDDCIEAYRWIKVNKTSKNVGLAGVRFKPERDAETCAINCDADDIPCKTNLVACTLLTNLDAVAARIHYM